MRSRSIHIHQGGAAIITALLVVMLAATIATYLLSQQSRALTRTARATERAQVTLYAEPTLDWARAVLFDSLNNSIYVALKQPWAQPVAAQPLVSAAGGAAGGAVGGTVGGAVVIASGLIHDEAAKFNLNNLVKADKTASADDIEIFKRLLKNLKLNPDLSDAVVDWLDDDNEPRPHGAEDGYYLSLASPYRTANQPMVQWQELGRVRGFDAVTLRRLAPYITALPTRTKVNLNTASPELIAALFPDLSVEDTAELIRRRMLTPFQNADGATNKKPSLTKALSTFDQVADVTSQYFSVSVAITGDAAAAHQTVLLDCTETKKGSWPRIIWVQAQ